MKKQLKNISFFIMFILLASEVYAEKAGFSSRHSAGLKLGFLRELSTDSPYGLPAGIGLFYQFTGNSRHPFYLGLDINAYGFPPLDENYETSLMLIPTFSMGYGFLKPLSGETAVGIFPIIKYGQYFRQFRYESETYSGSRPVLSAGVDLILYSDRHILFSLGLFYTLILDDRPVHFLAYRNRSGYVF